MKPKPINAFITKYLSLKYSYCSSNTLHDKAISLHKPDTLTYSFKVLKRHQYTTSFRFNSKIFICYEHLGICVLFTVGSSQM